MTYDLPSDFHITTILPQLTRVEDALARLDERLAALSFGRGIAERLLYDEACACLALENHLVLCEDLVLFDGNAYDGPPSMALTQASQVLRTWKKALQADPRKLLASQRPGEMPVADTANASDATGGIWHGCYDEVLDAWRTIVRRTTDLPPVLAAAIAADAWIKLQNGASARWRAGLLAALVLKARGKTRSFLLPLDVGQRFSRQHWIATHAFPDRITAVLDWAAVAADRARKEMQRLILVEQLLRRNLAGRRKNSRLPRLVDLLLHRPLISVPMAAKALRVSPQAVEIMLDELGSTPRLLTERKRFRVWGV